MRGAHLCSYRRGHSDLGPGGTSLSAKTILVAGAGLAGARACEGLRSLGFDGRLIMCGDEPHMPYDRPPLSKQYLAGSWDLDRVFLRPKEAVDALSAELLLGAEYGLRSLDVRRRVAMTVGGEEIHYDGLVLATGACPRRLPGLSELSRAHVLRTLDDADRLRPALVPGARLLIVGAGFIGLEVAATARGLGCQVVVVDPLSRPLGRVLGDSLGDVVQHMHEDQGVVFHLGTTVTEVEEGRDELRARTSSGATIEAEAVLVGIGVTPNVAWLAESGLNVGPDGLVCDEFLVAAPRVVAAGDLARFPMSGRRGGLVRVEHRTTAAELGEQAAHSLLAELSSDAPDLVKRAFESVLYVWSDQYDTKVQILGRPEPTDEIAVVEGSLSSRRFVACYGRDGALAGVVSFGRPRVLMKFRPLLLRDASFAEAIALDVA